MITAFVGLFINTIGFTIYFYWTQILWTDIDSGPCLESWNLMFFMMWLLCLFITVWSTIFVSFGLLIGLCCAPCIYKLVKEYIA